MAHGQAHHILAEIIQGGLVLETNGEEISNSGSYYSFDCVPTTVPLCVFVFGLLYDVDTTLSETCIEGQKELVRISESFISRWRRQRRPTKRINADSTRMAD